MRFHSRKKPKQADMKQVFNYACFLLARRNYSQKELLEKFHTRFIPDEKIFTAAFEKLEKLGLQSDESFSESFVRGHSGWGRRRLEIELKRRGISEEMIEIFLPDEIDELTRCRDTLAKKLKGEKISEEFKERQKLSAFLARRGFDLDAIREVMGF
ncbi:MAG: regulatory protein RecX [Patescibacteria group bacterium]